MLHTLRIENLALMEAVSLDFETGYTAVTGETGAGKSVLLGALSLLSGARGDKSLIRQGADTCVAEAAIGTEGNTRLADKLTELDLPACEEDALVIRRILGRQRGSRVTVNGAMATLSQLREIGECWIDFHGPGEPQKLFHENEQLALLDLFAGLAGPVAEYNGAYREWRAREAEIERLRNESRLSPEEAAFLKTQLEEIDALKLNGDRIHELEQDFRRIAGAQELRALCAEMDERFLGGKGVCSSLQAMLPLAQKLAELDPSAAALADRVESLVIEANDLSGEWRTLAGEVDFDPQQIRQIEADMDTWQSLRRRYGASVEAVLAKRDSMAEKLALQGNLEGTLQSHQEAADAMREALQKTAAGLRKKRLKAAHTLARESELLLKELGFKRPQLSIEINPVPTLGPTGDCQCRMTFSPNPGNALMPLNKIASSGEMARVMLAIKSVLATVDATPVLVFDEVDSNIGGEVASSVARLLGRLGGDHQVFCITHLPQVAAVAKNHYTVEKDQGDTTTTVTIRCVDGDREARLDELARMMGDRSSASARKHAVALLQYT